MTNNVEQEIEKLKQEIASLQARGVTVNLQAGTNDQKGASSVFIESDSKGMVKMGVKVYSNDLIGARASLTQAVEIWNDPRSEATRKAAFIPPKKTEEPPTAPTEAPTTTPQPPITPSPGDIGHGQLTATDDGHRDPAKKRRSA